MLLKLGETSWFYISAGPRYHSSTHWVLLHRVLLQIHWSKMAAFVSRIFWLHSELLKIHINIMQPRSSEPQCPNTEDMTPIERVFLTFLFGRQLKEEHWDVEEESSICKYCAGFESTSCAATDPWHRTHDFITSNISSVTWGWGFLYLSPTWRPLSKPLKAGYEI